MVTEEADEKRNAYYDDFNGQLALNSGKRKKIIS